MDLRLLLLDAADAAETGAPAVDPVAVLRHLQRRSRCRRRWQVTAGALLGLVLLGQALLPQPAVGAERPQPGVLLAEAP